MKIIEYHIIKRDDYILQLSIINYDFPIQTIHDLSKDIFEFICKKLYKDIDKILHNIDYKNEKRKSHIFFDEFIFLFKSIDQIKQITDILDEYMILDNMENN